MLRITFICSILVQFQWEVTGLRFASMFQDNMVLQRAPQSAVIWGYGDHVGDVVTVSVNGYPEVHTPIVKYKNTTGGVWKVKLPPVKDPGAFIIIALSNEGQIAITNVLFGDVWMCVGQTDMDLPLSKVINSSYEISKAFDHQTVRICKTTGQPSKYPQDDFQTSDINWDTPNKDTLQNFSALCWLYGVYLHDVLQRPIGLVQATFPESVEYHSNGSFDGIPPITSGYWNGLLYPLSQMTQRGVIWYQGTGNLAQIVNYGYEYTVLMSNIRSLCHKRSLNQTNNNLPFGIVQLGPVSSNVNGSSHAADFRWEQSFDYGVLPNDRMTYAFMATSMDIVDPISPDHPRYMQDITRRLGPGAQNIAYGDTAVEFRGPYVDNITFVNNNTKLMNIHYNQEIEVRSKSGFQFCCSKTSSEKCYPDDRHILAHIVSHDLMSVTLSYAGCGSDWVVGLSYAWSGSPCDGYKKCAVYSLHTNLPSPPYINGWPWYTPQRYV